MKKLYIKLSLVIAWSGIIFILLTMPMPVSQIDAVYGIDKLVHVFLFGVLSFLIIYSLLGADKAKVKSIFIFSFLLSASYSWLMEIAQSHLPTRQKSELDFLAGIAGIIIALIISYGLYRKKFFKT